MIKFVICSTTYLHRVHKLSTLENRLRLPSHSKNFLTANNQDNQFLPFQEPQKKSRTALITSSRELYFLKGTFKKEPGYTIQLLSFVGFPRPRSNRFQDKKIKITRSVIGLNNPHTKIADPVEGKYSHRYGYRKITDYRFQCSLVFCPSFTHYANCTKLFV